MTAPTGVDNDPDVTSRRRFLRECGALMGGAVLAGGLAGQETLAAADAAGVNNLPPNVPEWMKTPGDPMGGQLYGTPSPFEKDVIKNIPQNLKQYLSASGRTPLWDLDGTLRRDGLRLEALGRGSLGPAASAGGAAATTGGARGPASPARPAPAMHRARPDLCVQFLQPPDLGTEERDPDDKFEAVEGAPLDSDKTVRRSW
jgi:hypothetical protein